MKYCNHSWRIRDQLDVTNYYVSFHFFYAEHVSDINISIIRSLRFFLLNYHIYINAKNLHLYRTHDQCGDSIEKLQAPDDGCINVRNMLSIEEVK